MRGAGPGPGGPAIKQAVRVGKVFEVENFEAHRYTGRVVSPAVVQVVAQVSGEILEVGFQDGKPVRKGQMLYKIDPVQYEAAVKSAEAKIAECKAKLNYAQISYDRNKTLRNHNAVSQDTMDNTVSNYESAKASLLEAEADWIKAKDNLKKTTITAPMEGAAGVTSYTAGNYVTSSSGTLVKIIQVNPIRVRFSISNMDFRSIFGDVLNLMKQGRVRVAFADGTSYRKEGKVELIDNEANAKTDSVLIYAQFDNSTYELYAGSTVTVTLEKKLGEKCLAVLPSAVMHDSAGAYVYVVEKGNLIERKTVELGDADNTCQMIRSGLKEGETVVTGGTNKVMPGSEIIPVSEEK